MYIMLADLDQDGKRARAFIGDTMQDCWDDMLETWALEGTESENMIDCVQFFRVKYTVDPKLTVIFAVKWSELDSDAEFGEDDEPEID